MKHTPFAAAFLAAPLLVAAQPRGLGAGWKKGACQGTPITTIDHKPRVLLGEASVCLAWCQSPNNEPGVGQGPN
eukprot:COSAG01_NODE_31746_length_592_cov_0.726166_1_plen_73_part_01